MERLKTKLFESYLHQDMDWLERPGNSTGSLACLMFKDSFLVGGMAGGKLAALFQALLGVIISVGISLSYDLKLGLVAAIFIPIVMFTVYALMKIARNCDQQVVRIC